jgi:peptidoglycan/LPS O-acetylase OafA/YrhL
MTQDRSERIHSLDGLRGMAALIVLAFHVVDYVEMPQSVLTAWLVSPLGFFVNGPGGVHLFFVLSGFVLAITMGSERGFFGVLRYYVRRLFRIQPPYAVAVLFAWLVATGYPLGGYRTFVLGGTPCFQIPAPLLPSALLLPSVAYGQLPVGWSLYVELLMSAVFPALLFLGRRGHALVPLAIGVALLSPRHPSLFQMRFLFDFALGLAIYLHRDALRRRVEVLSRGAVAAWALVAVLAFQLPFALQRFAKGSAALEQDHAPVTIVSMAIGAGILIVLTLYTEPLRTWLSLPLARFFGRISYSLYLLHLSLLLVAICRVTGQSISWWEGLIVLAIVFVGSVGLADLMWRWVEEPAIRAGRFVSSFLPKRQTPS